VKQTRREDKLLKDTSTEVNEATTESLDDAELKAILNLSNQRTRLIRLGSSFVGRFRSTKI
jgi:hypothetical protein